MRICFWIALLSGAMLHGGTDPAAGVFEQIRDSVWRTKASGREVLVLPSGFIVRQGEQVQRFRWAGSMRLETLMAGEPAAGHSYDLSATGSRELARARSVRAVSVDKQLSVHYYVGDRGFEFDIELAPGASTAGIALDSVDGGFSLDGAGRVCVDGNPLLLKPVAYAADAAGDRRQVVAEYRFETPRRLSIQTGKVQPDERLVIDPVMTYATYFGGSDEESPIAMREFSDGSLIIVAHTRSLDIPQAVSLDGVLVKPFGLPRTTHCFVAKLSPATKQIHFVSYLKDRFCAAMDLDNSGGILLAGGQGASTLPSRISPNWVSGGVNFLARLSADGGTVEYSALPGVSCNSLEYLLFLAAGLGDTAYLATNCKYEGPNIPGGYQEDPGSIVVFRYNLAEKRFDRQTYFADKYTGFAGMEVSPFGGVILFGSTSSQEFPLVSPIQSEPPTQFQRAGFVSALSPDLETLVFSTYIGGKGGYTSVDTVKPETDGTIWIEGSTAEVALPGLAQDHHLTDAHHSAPFAAQIRPGTIGIRKGYFAAEFEFWSNVSIRSVLLADHRFCMYQYRVKTNTALPGGAALRAGDSTAMLACLSDAGDHLDIVTPIVSEDQIFSPVVTPSQSGGVWSLTTHGRGARYGVPLELAPGAIQGYLPDLPYSDTDLILRHIDLSVPRPILVHPPEPRLVALRGPTASTVHFAGWNFALGMELEVGGRRYPLNVDAPTNANLELTGRASNTFDTFLDLPAGYYTGRLVIPTEPEPIASEPFRVAIENMAPVAKPFSRTSDPLVFDVAVPVYDDSRVLWNGQSIALSPPDAVGTRQVRIPAELASSGTGELVLINPPPGGGVRRAEVRIEGGTSSLYWDAGPAPIHIGGEGFAVDRSRRLLYTIQDWVAGAWTISCFRLPETEPFRSVSFPRDADTVLVDFDLSADGRFLYVFDNLLRVWRFQTATFENDLRFQLTSDAPLESKTENRHSLHVLDDAPESVLIVTPAGRMIVYDRDQPRPYTTWDFPSQSVLVSDPVLVADSYVYALPSTRLLRYVPCLVRYPLDGRGFGPPDEFCNLGTQWGKYPEMKKYGDGLVLENDGNIKGVVVDVRAAGVRVIRSYTMYALNSNLSFEPRRAHYNLSTAATWFLEITDRNTGERVGHFPRAEALMNMPNNILLLDDELMVFTDDSYPPSIKVVPDWRAVTAWYP